MLSVLKGLAALGLLVHGVAGGGKNVHYQETTTTVQVTHYLDVTVYSTKTSLVTTCITEVTTTTLHFVVSVTATDSRTVTTTQTDSATVTNTATASTTITNTATALATVTDTRTDSATVTNTETDSTTVTNTETDSTTVTNTRTDSATITNTETDSTTVTNTGTALVTITNTRTDSETLTNTATTTTTVPTTTYTTRTVFSTTVDPCPKSCSISAETVNLYFWPTDRPHTYPTTYVHPTLSYTFTSPSVYMYIPTAVGINTRGERAGPSTSRWMLPLHLDEVSTIAPQAGRPGNVTRQLTLADLGTDCPQTADPTAIATMVDSRCDPVLAAPTKVRSWAYPCNACGRFGLFDPPYAVPTLTGSLVIPTTVVTQLPPVTITAPAPPLPPVTTPPPPPAPSPGSGVLVLVYRDAQGHSLGTTALTVPGISGTVTSSVVVPAINTAPTGQLCSPTLPASSSPTTSDVAGPATSTPATGTAAARYGTPGFTAAWLAAGIVVVLCL